MPVTLKLTVGRSYDGRRAADVLDAMQAGQILLADRAHDISALRAAVSVQLV
jgi:hypothetical protein